MKTHWQNLLSACLLMVAVTMHAQAPALVSAHKTLYQTSAATCAQRTAEVFTQLGITATESTPISFFGANREYAVHVYFLSFGSNLNALVAVSTLGQQKNAAVLRDQILQYLTTAQPLSSTSNEATLRLDKTTFSPGEAITVYFTAPAVYAGDAWVGILPANIEHGSEAKNDQYDMTYQYINKRTSGTMTFTAPAQEGSYDFRLHDTDNNGKEITYVTFTVRVTATPPPQIITPPRTNEATLRLDKTTFSPGEAITVYFTAPAAYANDAWVGILPANIEHGSEAKNDQHDMTYQYINKRTSGTMTFTAPAQEGSYDFRLHDTDNNGKEITYITFRVQK